MPPPSATRGGLVRCTSHYICCCHASTIRYKSGLTKSGVPAITSSDLLQKLNLPAISAILLKLNLPAAIPAVHHTSDVPTARGSVSSVPATGTCYSSYV